MSNASDGKWGLDRKRGEKRDKRGVKRSKKRLEY